MSLPSVFQEAASHRIFDEFGAAVQIQLIHDMRAMGIHRFRADDEPLGYLVIGVALGNQLEDLTFALGEAAVTVLLFSCSYPLQVIPYHDRLSCWREIELSALDNPEGRD